MRKKRKKKGGCLTVLITMVLMVALSFIIGHVVKGASSLILGDLDWAERILAQREGEYPVVLPNNPWEESSEEGDEQEDVALPEYEDEDVAEEQPVEQAEEQTDEIENQTDVQPEERSEESEEETADQTDETEEQPEEHAEEQPEGQVEEPEEQPEERLEEEQEEQVEKPEGTITGYYYEQLSDDQKKYYRELLEECLQFKETVKIQGFPLEYLRDVVTALSFDRPDLFWVGYGHSYSYIGSTVDEITFTMPADAKREYEEVENIANSVVSSIPSGSTEYEKIKYLYDWIVNNTDYQFTERDQDVRSVFIDGRSVCAGYSSAFALLCNKAGIRCTTAVGDIIGRESHAWNLVYIDNVPYWVDVTWGDPVFVDKSQKDALQNYIYLCMPDDEIFTTHVLDTHMGFDEGRSWAYPNCTSSQYNYYRMNNLFFESFDSASITDYLLEKVENGELRDIEMQFGSSEAYEQAYNYLFTQENIFAIIRELHPYGTIYAEHMRDEKGRYLQINIEIE